jgi:hypothetical protein
VIQKILSLEKVNLSVPRREKRLLWTLVVELVGGSSRVRRVEKKVAFFATFQYRWTVIYAILNTELRR